MILTRKSSLTNKVNSMELNITRKQLNEWEGGESARDTFPNLTIDERLFIISGITTEEWSKSLRDMPFLETQDIGDWNETR
tara:strand:+ start:122 stop:364 length:243 start_codon:yes stop_codon:yes gene_type:complete